MAYGSERTIRGNGRWAKITHRARGLYVVACGWEGNFKGDARPLQRGRKDWAQIAAQGWIDGF